MNGNAMRAATARTIHRLAVLSFTLFLLAACDTVPSDNDAPASSASGHQALALSVARQVVYGPVNNSNPFEHVGLRHNDAVHAVMLAAQPWDTLSFPTMNARIQKSIPAWAVEEMDVPEDRAMLHVKTAYAMRIDSTARRQLASFDQPGYTARETRYLRRIGTLLCEATRFDHLEQGLLAIERDILAEAWPADRTRETAALVGISIAKHSLAYWKHVFCIAEGIDPADADASGSLRKESSMLIHLITRCDIVVAADVIAGTAAGEGAAVFGPLVQLEAAIISGGTVSVLVATLVYWPDIMNFFREICPWK